MKMDDAQRLAAPAPAVPPEVVAQIGAITRMLHDTLQQLGVMPRLQSAAADLPDARSRLQFIARKTADAANRVLDSVDRAKAEHAHIASATREIAASLGADPVKAVASGAVMNFVEGVEASTARIDAQLTDIMLAQDFHDLTGQVVGKVVALAGELEDSLVKLLVSVVPPEQRERVDTAPAPAAVSAAPVRQGPVLQGPVLQGPVVDATGRADVVTNQEQVDDLLASLGF
jgi:chemotaxis protein CheZ